MLSSLAQARIRRSSVRRVYPRWWARARAKQSTRLKARPPTLITDCRRNTSRFQGFNAKPQSDQALPVIAAQVNKFLTEQQVGHGELEAQLEHPVEQFPLGKLDQNGAVADEDLHDVSVGGSRHDPLDFADAQAKQFGGLGLRDHVLRQRPQT